MHSLEYENQSNGSYLIYHILPEESVNTVVLGMVTNNDIEGILKMSKVQINSDVQIRYAISAKRQLKEYLKNQHLTPEEILDILFSILNIIVNAQDYMIRQDEFVLDIEYIYVDVHTKKPYIMCCPINQKQTSQADIGVFIKTFIFSIGYTDPSILKVTSRIMSMTNDKKTVAEFRDEVRKEMLVKPERGQKHNVAQNSTVAPQNVKGYTNEMVSSDSVSEDRAVPNVIEYDNNKSGKQEENKDKKRDINIPNSSSFDIPGPSGGAVISNKTNSKKLKASGKGILGGLVRKDKGTKGNTAEEKKIAVNPIIPQNVPKPKPYIPVAEEHAATMEPIDDTILTSEVYAEETNPSLLRVKNNEIIVINKEYFKLGRSRTKVDYQIENNPEISNEHAAIIRRGSDYYITDTNSSNHTYVDGKMLKNGEEVMLRNKTNIRMAKENFIFKM